MAGLRTRAQSDVGARHAVPLPSLDEVLNKNHRDGG